LRFIGQIFLLLPAPLRSDALNEGIPYSYRVHIWYRKTRMARLQSDEGCMMIDLVIWAQYINVTDTQTATSPYQMPCQCTTSGGKNDCSTRQHAIMQLQKQAVGLWENVLYNLQSTTCLTCLVIKTHLIYKPMTHLPNI